MVDGERIVDPTSRSSETYFRFKDCIREIYPECSLSPNMKMVQSTIPMNSFNLRGSSALLMRGFLVFRARDGESMADSFRNIRLFPFVLQL
jgi:hypothetical protein